MRRTIMHIAATAVLALSGCSTIYEYPDLPGVDPNAVDVRLNLVVDYKQDFDTTWTVTKSAAAASADIDAVPRVIVEVYAEENYSSSPYIRKVVEIDDADKGMQKIGIDMKLAPRPYIIVAWADYSDGDVSNNLYYETEQLYSIRLNENDRANTPIKDAFWAAERIDLTKYMGEWFVEVEEELLLTRTTSRFEIITRDVDRFLTDSNLLQEYLQNLKVKVHYAGFRPSEFDGFTGNLTDAVHGTEFECGLKQIDGQSAVLAFDYLLAGNDDSAVTIDIGIYNEDGELIQNIPGVRIPFRRNVITKVYGNFLTMKFDPYIGIDAEYDGEFNIYL